MTRYPVYLEVHEDGRTMAHVLDPAPGAERSLPGCISRAPDRQEVLRRLPDAIRDYYDWLRRHGEPVSPTDAGPIPPDEPVEYEIVGESIGYGPFDPGNAAALFPPDRAPVTPAELERFFRLMGYARADLLALVCDLPDSVLDWQPDPGSLAIRRLLRHVGNAEQWYISRLVPLETLPAEWKHDDEMSIFDHLAMVRRTAVARLRGLTEVERSEVFYPRAWTDHPDEPWTARKVLRRFLEHEREHTGQVREILAAWRTHLMARLAVERAGLLEQLTGLDEATLAHLPVFDRWTAKDLLAHIAAWDEYFTERVTLVLAGRQTEIVGVDPDERNAITYAERRDWPLDRAVAACLEGRAEALQLLKRVSDEELHRRRSFPWGQASLRLWTQWRGQHDAEHAAQLAAWRQAQNPGNKAGARTVLLAALQAGREALLVVAALVPPEERASRLVCGEWTLKDVLGHVADWEWFCVENLAAMAAGRPPEPDYGGDLETWNREHASARRDQPWETVWADLHAARRALIQVVEGFGQTDLERVFLSASGHEGTPYQWAHACLDHDREHATDLRALLSAVW